MTSIIIRCEKCGKVLKGKMKKSNIVGKCPRCKDKFVVPDPVAQDNRQYKRTIIPESKYVCSVPASLTNNKKPVNYRIIYTEVSPVEFALNRTDQVPLLDISEGGMGIIIRSINASGKVLPGDIFIVELDFPIFIKPVYTEVEVCWLKPIKDDKLMHVGVRFNRTGEDFKKVLKCILKFISSKTQSLDFETWGSFS